MRLLYGGYLAAQFAALTRELFASQDLFEVAERVGDLALECIPGVVASGVTFFEGVRPMAHVATDDVAHQLDAYQLAREEGPICESLDGGEPVRSVTWPVTCGGRRSGPWPPSSASPGSPPVAPPCVATRTGTRSAP